MSGFSWMSRVSRGVRAAQIRRAMSSGGAKTEGEIHPVFFKLKEKQAAMQKNDGLKVIIFHNSFSLLSSCLNHHHVKVVDLVTFNMSFC